MRTVACFAAAQRFFYTAVVFPSARLPGPVGHAPVWLEEATLGEQRGLAEPWLPPHVAEQSRSLVGSAAVQRPLAAALAALTVGMALLILKCWKVRGETEVRTLELRRTGTSGWLSCIGAAAPTHARQLRVPLAAQVLFAQRAPEAEAQRKFVRRFARSVGFQMRLAGGVIMSAAPDRRSTLSRAEAVEVYDRFAVTGYVGGKDASSGYGGPAVAAMLRMADFESATEVLDYGPGAGKLAELVLARCPELRWRGVDQSPQMVESASERLFSFGDRARIELLEDGDPSAVVAAPGSVDRFVSTYCLDLLAEKDMYAVLDLAERSLDQEKGLLLLAGITWGYRDSVRTFFMTLLWEVLYRVWRKKVGGCRPQQLVPYLRSRGWRVEKFERTMPSGFPWMVSEVVSARPPKAKLKIEPAAKSANSPGTSARAGAAPRLSMTATAPRPLGVGEAELRLVREAVGLVEQRVPVSAAPPAVARLAVPRSQDALLELYIAEPAAFQHRTPYYGIVWPSALGLAGAVAAHVRAGDRCVELGSGLGLGGIAAALTTHAASVLLTDHDPAAARLGRLNARLSGVADRVTSCARDWAALEAWPPTYFDCAIAADIIYEEDACVPMAVFTYEA